MEFISTNFINRCLRRLGGVTVVGSIAGRRIYMHTYRWADHATVACVEIGGIAKVAAAAAAAAAAAVIVAIVVFRKNQPRFSG